MYIYMYVLYIYIDRTRTTQVRLRSTPHDVVPRDVTGVQHDSHCRNGGNSYQYLVNIPGLEKEKPTRCILYHQPVLHRPSVPPIVEKEDVVLIAKAALLAFRQKLPLLVFWNWAAASMAPLYIDASCNQQSENFSIKNLRHVTGRSHVGCCLPHDDTGTHALCGRMQAASEAACCKPIHFFPPLVRQLFRICPAANALHPACALQRAWPCCILAGETRLCRNLVSVSYRFPIYICICICIPIYKPCQCV